VVHVLDAAAPEQRGAGGGGVTQTQAGVVRWVGCRTTNPCAAQKSTRGPYPRWEARKFDLPCPWENRMTGSLSPVLGADTFTSRGTGRPGIGSVTGLYVTTDWGVFTGRPAASVKGSLMTGLLVVEGVRAGGLVVSRTLGGRGLVRRLGGARGHAEAGWVRWRAA